MDSIYLDQVHPMNHHWINALRVLGQENDRRFNHFLDYFKISYGPWDVFTQDWILPMSFSREQPKLAGYNMYPIVKNGDSYESVTKETLDRWLERYPEDTKSFKSPFNSYPN